MSVCLALWILLPVMLTSVYASENPDIQHNPHDAQTTAFIGISAALSATTVALGGISPTVTAIAIGGALGSLSRYFVSTHVGARYGSEFPYGTMTVNIVGSFLFGTVGGWVARRDHIADTAWLDLMTTGFLGGFTTFSTFSNDTVQIAREEGMLTAALYTGLSVGISVLSVLAGEMVGIRWLP